MFNYVSGPKAGYAGVGLYTKVKPNKVTYGLGTKNEHFDGRLITAEYEKFFVCAVCKFFFFYSFEWSMKMHIEPKKNQSIK